MQSNVKIDIQGAIVLTFFMYGANVGSKKPSTHPDTRIDNPNNEK